MDYSVFAVAPGVVMLVLAIRTLIQRELLPLDAPKWIVPAATLTIAVAACIIWTAPPWQDQLARGIASGLAAMGFWSGTKATLGK